MARTVLLIGTRKGRFLLESDADRRDWELRGPFCEGWPVYHAVFDEDTGTIYAAAASEWHGSAVWRSTDLGETWTLSSEGLAYDEGKRKLSKVSTLAVAHGRVLVGVEAPGIFESTDGGETFSLLSTLAGQPGSEEWDDPANQPPGHLGISALIPDTDDPSRFWAIVQGVGLFETTDDGATWTPRNRGLRADWPRPHEEVGFCVHKARPLARRPDRHVPAEPRRHAPQRRRRPLVDGDHRGPADRVRLRRRGAPARPRHVLRRPARPGPRPHDARRPGQPSGARATPARAGSSSIAGLPQRRRAPRRAPRGRWRSTTHDVPGLYFGTSTGPAVRERRRGRAAGARSRATCRRSRRSRSRSSIGLMAELHLPMTLTPLFAGLPRRLERRRGDGRRRDRGARGAMARPARPPLRARPAAAAAHPRLRRPGAGALDTPLEARSRVDVIAAISGG